MDKSQLTLVTQGINGGLSKRKEMIFISVRVDSEGESEHFENRISFDSIGFLREDENQTAIKIVAKGSTIYHGSYSEFIECLKFGVEVRNFGKGGKP